jgi:hypothetical protein
MNEDLIQFYIEHNIPFTITFSKPWYNDYSESISDIILSTEKYEVNKNKSI